VCVCVCVCGRGGGRVCGCVCVCVWRGGGEGVVEDPLSKFFLRGSRRVISYYSVGFYSSSRSSRLGQADAGCRGWGSHATPVCFNYTFIFAKLQRPDDER